MKIPRRSKPTVIARRKPLTPPGWPNARQGFPSNSHESMWHAIEINGRVYPWLWQANVQMWDCGQGLIKPSIMARHIYKGLVSIVYREPPA